MALPVTPPYVFGNVTSSIPLTNLDADFATIYAAVNGIGNGTVSLANVTITGGSIQNVAFTLDSINNTPIGNVTPSTAVVTSLTDTGLTPTRVTYAGTGGLLQDSANMTFNGTTFTLANDASINGLTVGRGTNSVGTNTATGFQALYSGSLSGGYNSAFGQYALAVNTSGLGNSAFGHSVLASNTTGIANCGFGSTNGSVNQTLVSNTTGGYNSAFGAGALASNTTASNNTAVGYQAGYSNTTGTNLAFVGRQAGYTNSTGNGNAALGVYALYTNSTGNSNTAVGSNDTNYLGALQSNTTGSSNTAVGTGSLGSNTTASNNTAVGYQAGYNSTGAYNTYLGQYAGGAVTSGTNNTFLGAQAGQTVTTGSYNVCVGYNNTTSAAGDSNSIVIAAFNTNGKGTNTGFISPNGGGVYQGNNSTLWSITSDQRLKKNIVDNTDGLNKITAIQVRNFEYRTADEVTELEPQNAIDIKGVQLGAIAQELQAILPECVKTESTGVMSVDTTNLTWYLINAVKELNAKVTALENK